MAKELLHTMFLHMETSPSITLNEGDVESTLRLVLVDGLAYAQVLVPYCMRIIKQTLVAANAAAAAAAAAAGQAAEVAMAGSAESVKLDQSQILPPHLLQAQLTMLQQKRAKLLEQALSEAELKLTDLQNLTRRVCVLKGRFTVGGIIAHKEINQRVMQTVVFNQHASLGNAFINEVIDALLNAIDSKLP